MLKLNSELRAQAREALQGNWVMAAVAALIYSAIVSATSYLPLVGTLLVGLPVAYGFTILMFSVIKGAKDIDLGILFEGFKDYSRIMGTVVLVFIYTFLWSLLLIIPGIIKHYSYAMTPYILKEEPEMKNNAAFLASSVNMGSSTSTPSSDQVPELRKAIGLSTAGTAATALAVSCEPTAITSTIPSPVSRAISSFRVSTTSQINYRI